MVSWSWLASLTGDREVRKAPCGAESPPPTIFFRASFLSSLCRRTLSFPGLGIRGGGAPGGPWGQGPAASGVIEAVEISIAVPWGGEGQPSAGREGTWSPCCAGGPEAQRSYCLASTALFPEHGAPARCIPDTSVSRSNSVGRLCRHPQLEMSPQRPESLVGDGRGLEPASTCRLCAPPGPGGPWASSKWGARVGPGTHEGRKRARPQTREGAPCRRRPDHRRVCCEPVVRWRPEAQRAEAASSEVDWPGCGSNFAELR